MRVKYIVYFTTAFGAVFEVAVLKALIASMKLRLGWLEHVIFAGSFEPNQLVVGEHKFYVYRSLWDVHAQMKAYATAIA